MGWKKASIVEANKPIRKTLRPCKEESVNWDSTENLYIEGDNETLERRLP
jgi:adenine-specific DNA-methyltransferase